MMRFDPNTLLLYGVTHRSQGEDAFLLSIEQALRGGVTMLQLREKELSDPELLALAQKVKPLCRRFGVPLILNDRVEVALQCGADGVHVGIEDAPVAEIRQRAPESFLIGATAKTVAQAIAAEQAGADYLGVGAVFPSPTKQNALRITTTQLQEICGSVAIPAVAIGGIGLSNIEQLRGGGMAGFAVVSAIFGAENTELAAKNLKEKAKEVILP